MQFDVGCFYQAVREVILLGGRTSAKSHNKYIAKAYDRIVTLVKKGNKTAMRDHAQSRGESLNGFVNRAIAETLERDGSGAP
jgi:hypothetical protein